MLRQRARGAAGALVAATHGRGMWAVNRCPIPWSSLAVSLGPESPLNVATKGSERQPTVSVRGADSYTPADDLWIVTCYFNPQSYATRLENYHPRIRA